ncbi:hypothetical protein B566_EDAN002212 [Ephemera danica]|nr:hypothetical protein B566_EDAN002212 [Ephemera danica]
MYPWISCCKPLLKMESDETDSWPVENEEVMGIEDYSDEPHFELGACAIPQYGIKHGRNKFQQYETKSSSEEYEDVHDEDDDEDEVHTDFSRISEYAPKQQVQNPRKPTKSKQAPPVKPSWIDGQDGSLPAGAVEGVVNPKETVYIARTKVGGKWVLCNVNPKWLQIENTDDFEVPKNSLCVDSNEVGTKLYFGVVTTRNGSFLGKVLNGVCHVLKDEEVQKFKKYKILTLPGAELQILCNRQRVTYTSPTQQNDQFSDEESYNRNEAEYDWVKASNGSIPRGALMGCKNQHGPVYVARFKHQGVMQPGKLIPTYGYCYTAVNGEEIKSNQYEVLCNINAKWITMTEGDKQIPSGAVLADSTNEGQDLYIGRIVPAGSGRCIIICGKKEYVYRDFEILVASKRSSQTTSRHRQHPSTVRIRGDPWSGSNDMPPRTISHAQTRRKNTPVKVAAPTPVKVAAPTKSSIFEPILNFINIGRPAVLPIPTTVNSSKGSWELASDGEVPVGAVVGGRNLQGDIYVARVTHEGEIFPGKLIPSFRGCFVSNNGQEIKAKTYEVLCDCDAAWIKMKAGSKIPDNAIPAGVDKNDEPLYVGHVITGNVTNLGKVEKSSGKCFVLKNKVEHSINDYEILVLATGKEPTTSIAEKLSAKLDAIKIKGMSTSEELHPLKSIEADYTMIEKVWNKIHFQKYEHFRQILVKEKVDQNEKLLFHGSPHCDQIWKSGFDERHATSGMFGAGLSFIPGNIQDRKMNSKELTMKLRL